VRESVKGSHTLALAEAWQRLLAMPGEKVAIATNETADAIAPAVFLLLPT
jgi:hypothetical protein